MKTWKKKQINEQLWLVEVYRETTYEEYRGEDLKAGKKQTNKWTTQPVGRSGFHRGEDLNKRNEKKNQLNEQLWLVQVYREATHEELLGVKT